jgi:hypothetical protein
MDEDEMLDGDLALRLDSLELFGFDRSTMEDFLSEHVEAASERLFWLEERREAASELEDRAVALSQASPSHADVLDSFKMRFSNPFSLESVMAEFEQWMRKHVPWEPFLHRAKPAWYQSEHGETWALLFRRLAGLDPSSHPSVGPLHPLFEQPERFDEIFRHLETIEEDERRQYAMVHSGSEALRSHGYDLGGIDALPLLQALKEIEEWQSFHDRRERVRLTIVQLVQPFDRSLAEEFERQCSTINHYNSMAELDDVQQHVHELAKTLEDRRLALSETIEGWRQNGIVFPHTGPLQPGDLMEWEANHDVVAASIKTHLELKEKWQRFDKYWPSRTRDSASMVGHLDQTDELRNVVDELDALWKKVELDALDLLQTYEHAGLDVANWRQRVFEEPLSALERLTHQRELWDRRVALMERLSALDVSFHGQDDVDVRLHVLASEDVEGEILEEIQDFISRFERRIRRHRDMLEEELASLRRADKMPHEVLTGGMTLRELEQHVGNLQRSSNGNQPLQTTAASNMRGPLKQEIQWLYERGWLVDSWRSTVEQNPLQVARELNAAKPHIEHHEVLRRRLLALPWGRDVELALGVELDVKQPHRLAMLHQRIPEFANHLAQRPMEDENFSIHIWHPVTDRPTLMPVPESTGAHPILQPVSTLDDAHEAMLEAMDSQTTVEEAVSETPSTPERLEPVIAEVKAPAPMVEPAVVVPANDPPPALPPAPPEPEEPMLQAENVAEVSEKEALTAPPAQVDEKVSGEQEIKATKEALGALAELLALLGLNELAEQVNDGGIEAFGAVRRGLAEHVNVVPRDVRIGRLLRLTLRLLPKGDDDDLHRAKMIQSISSGIPSLKRWMRRRLEARHSGAKGHFLEDAASLGEALERIPGLGQRVPLNTDTWALPNDMKGLEKEVQRLNAAIQLPSAGGVKA